MSHALRSLAVAAALLAGCSNLKVQTQFDPSARYPSYRTYAWLPAEPGAEQSQTFRDPAVHLLITGAIDRELARKGFVRAAPEQRPDLYVSALGWGREKIEVSSYGYSYGPGYAYGPFGPGPYRAPVPAVRVRQITEGTLILDLVDGSSMKLVWRGVATDILTSAGEVPAVIDGAVAKLLEAYPPSP